MNGPQGGHQGTGIGKPGHEKTGKKLGHRRVGDDGFVTYKRFETSQLIGSIQLGLEYVFTNEANFPDRDLLYTVCNYVLVLHIWYLIELVFTNC
jgi:hypothetical protein